MKTWTMHIEEDPENGDLILPFPAELLSEVGWVEGDTLEWENNNDGSWSLRKKEMELPLDDREEAILTLLKKVSNLECENQDLKSEIKRLKWTLEEQD